MDLVFHLYSQKMNVIVLENLYPSSDSRFYLSKHRRYLKKTSRFRVLRVIYLISWLVKLKSLSKKLLIKYKPDFVILSSDRYLELGLMISRDCQYLQIPTFILGIDYFYVENFEGYYNKARKPLYSYKFYDRSYFICSRIKYFPSRIFI